MTDKELHRLFQRHNRLVHEHMKVHGNLCSRGGHRWEELLAVYKAILTELVKRGFQVKATVSPENIVLEGNLNRQVFEAVRDRLESDFSVPEH